MLAPLLNPLRSSNLPSIELYYLNQVHPLHPFLICYQAAFTPKIKSILICHIIQSFLLPLQICHPSHLVHHRPATMHPLYLLKLLITHHLLLSINPTIPIVKRHAIPNPAKTVYFIIFSLSRASLFSAYLIRYCPICAIFSTVSALSFISSLTSLSIFSSSLGLRPRALSCCQVLLLSLTSPHNSPQTAMH